eukprot:11794634-Heterocapsa_arctica.AAC.1
MNEIMTRTQATIILSILGLGLIYRQQGHSELADMPDIINFLEAELRGLNMDDYMHRIRGQHPETRDDQIADTEIMTERERAPIIYLDTNLQDQEMIEEIWTNFGAEEFEATMKIKDKDRNQFTEDDRGISARHFLELNDKRDGTCDDGKIMRANYTNI